VVSGAIAVEGGGSVFLWQPVTAMAANAAALSMLDFQVIDCRELIFVLFLS